MAVIVWAIRDPAASPVLGLIIGGGIGNLIDRVTRPPGGGRGHVIDFIYLSFWPTFNLADAAIVVGVGAMLLLAMRENPDRHVLTVLLVDAGGRGRAPGRLAGRGPPAGAVPMSRS